VRPVYYSRPRISIAVSPAAKINISRNYQKGLRLGIAAVSCTLTRASRLLRNKTATAAPLALSRN
jgi:hypothetical protein